MSHCIHNIVCKLADSQWCNDKCMYKLVEEKFTSTDSQLLKQAIALLERCGRNISDRCLKEGVKI